jgi:hypothetical protein
VILRSPKASSRPRSPGKRSYFCQSLIGLLAGSLALVAACQPVSQPGAVLPAATPTPFGPAGQLPAGGLVLDRPERIVQAFLTDVQEAPDQLGGYMSSTLQKEYPHDAIIATLGLPGNIEGFALQAAVVSPPMALANVFVNVTSGDTIFHYRFVLIIEHDKWVISSIERQ